MLRNKSNPILVLSQSDNFDLVNSISSGRISRKSCSSGFCSFIVAMKSFADISPEVIANWFSNPSGKSNSFAGNLSVWKLMPWPNCWSRMMVFWKTRAALGVVTMVAFMP
ncbi:hypothetical protein OWV82_011324 [Melia azedarach]|uniref:Uncharacterized protein n=1 Tax=Melia azedarach TaxID=155640 RepID=A0ACC1XYR2_MELAZ|nr:hypothetical protein OWV82_011324 [Melia azedarach]